jgi:ATP-binding cassette subfamily B protein
LLQSFPGPAGLVEFKNVSFKYPGAQEYLLQDINFTAKPGQTTAFIGSTGSGKSTLINLIPRFYDATEGQILVDGADVRTVKTKSLRGKIGYIPQKALLFSGLISSNIKFGEVADVNITDEDMEDAAAIAQAAEFIEDKPDKYNEPIAQAGANVSGGQKQRLSIARAIAKIGKRPGIFIFDDSFSALDYKTDAALRRAIAAKLGGSTVLVVAQRIGTIKNADQIIVLDQGRIVGIGKHAELLTGCEVYRQIALSQLSEAELAL